MPANKRMLIPHELLHASLQESVDEKRTLCPPEDFRKLSMMTKGSIWAPRKGAEEKDALFRRQPRISKRSIVIIAALNLELCGGHPYQALALGYACAMGLVNIGGDGLTREWVASKSAPSREDVEKVVRYFSSLKGDPTLIGDLISFVGYRRISRTHIYDSNDQRAEHKSSQIDLDAVARMVAGANGMAVENVDEAGALYYGCHSYSLGGAVGFHHWWSRSAYGGPTMKVRRTPVGDLWKSAAIVDAGFVTLLRLPLLGQQLTQFRGIHGDLVDKLEGIREHPWRTSSLSKLLCGQDPVELGTSPFVLFMSTLIAGAAEGEFMPVSIKQSYFIRRTTHENASLVRTWSDLFDGLSRRLRDTDLSNIVGDIARSLNLDYEGAGAEMPPGRQEVIEQPANQLIELRGPGDQDDDAKV